MPTWAKEDSAEFWRACDDLERANGRAYREFEVALPRELPHKEQAALVRQFVSEQLGDRHAYAWAIHDKGDGNPHAHIMFSERIQDGIDRPKEQYFKRANGKVPEHGGCRKDDRWNVGRGQKSEVLFEARARWADLQNVHLERAEELSRVDHRSLEAQGIERTPQVHVGFRHQNRPEVRAERHQRNEDLKLASQESQARDQLATCQAELEEITATLREMEARKAQAELVAAQREKARQEQERARIKRLRKSEERMRREKKAREHWRGNPESLSQQVAHRVPSHGVAEEALKGTSPERSQVPQAKIQVRPELAPQPSQKPAERPRTPKDLKHSQLNLRPVVPERPKVQVPAPVRQEAKKIETVPERPPEVNQVSWPVVRASVKERLVDALQALLAADAAYKKSFRAPREKVAQAIKQAQEDKARKLDLALSAARGHAAAHGTADTMLLVKERLGREKFDLASEFERGLGRDRGMEH